MKRQLGPMDIFFPVPTALIVSGTMENADVATIAWVGMVSSTPPTVAVSFFKNRYSLENIRATKEFTVNIPSADLVREADFCGLASGRNVDKLTKTGLTPIPGNRTQTPIIKECPFNLQCQVIGEMELGDYVMILGEVLETHIDEDKVAMNNDHPKIDLAKVNPLVYAATVREYWSLGQKLGDAFQVGKELMKK